VQSSINESTNAPQELLGDKLTFELVKYNQHGLGKTEGSAKWTAGVCTAAVKVMHDAFAPLVMEDGSDMIHLVCHSAFDEIDARSPSDFSGFRLAVIRQRGTVLCAATVRCFGASFAEMPFIATRDGYRKTGLCRKLISAITAKLNAWGVQWLLLPSVPETQSMWIRKFGFEVMTAAELAGVEGRIVTPEADNVKMLKLRITAATQLQALAIPPAVATPPTSKGKKMARPQARPLAVPSTGTVSAQPSVERGTGSFASLAAVVPGGPVARGAPALAAAAAQTLQRACTEEALGHTLADVLLSTLYDVDDERRSAQVEIHALRMQLAQQERTITALKGQLAAPSQAVPMEVAPRAATPPVDDATGNDDSGGDEALAVLRAIAAMSPEREQRPAEATASIEPVAQPSPAAVTPQQAVVPQIKPAPFIDDEAARQEAIMFASAVFSRMPPGASTWLSDGSGTPLLPGAPLPFDTGAEDENNTPGAYFQMMSATEEQIEVQYF